MAPHDLHQEEQDRAGSSEGEPKAKLSPNGGAAPDEVLIALADSERRAVLYYLQEHGTATVEELSRLVASMETGAQPDEVSEDAIERATVELIHSHLPKLAAVLIIEFDEQNLIVQYTEPSPLLDNFLRFIKRIDSTETSFSG